MNGNVPLLSTAELLMQDISPVSSWKISDKSSDRKTFFSVNQHIGALAAAEAKRKKRDADFAQHIKTMADMRKKGASFAAIGKRVGKSKQTVNLYFKQNEHLFKE